MARHVGVLIDGDDLADGLHGAVVCDVQTRKRLSRQTLLLLNEAEQDVLGAHVGLMQGSRLILSKDKHFARFVRELLE